MTELLERLLVAIKGLTFVNVAVLAVLVLLTVPVYFVYRMLNDPQLMGAVLSEFREIRTKTDCSLYYSQSAGSAPTWSVTNQFAERNAEEWAIVVRIKFEPDDAAMRDYCSSLEDVIRYLHDPDLPPPAFPGSAKTMVWREHHPGKEGP